MAKDSIKEKYGFEAHELLENVVLRLKIIEDYISQGDLITTGYFKIKRICDLKAMRREVLDISKDVKEKCLEIERLHKLLESALLLIDFIPEATLSEIADQQLQALKKEMGDH
jgi:hypothetical protein